jgi:hypothetical protein
MREEGFGLRLVQGVSGCRYNRNIQPFLHEPCALALRSQLRIPLKRSSPIRGFVPVEAADGHVEPRSSIF